MGIPVHSQGSTGSFDYSPSPQPSPVKGEGALSLLHWREKARMRGERPVRDKRNRRSGYNRKTLQGSKRGIALIIDNAYPFPPSGRRLAAGD